MDHVGRYRLGLAALGLLACSVDARQLEPATGSAGSFMRDPGDGAGGDGNAAGGDGAGPSDLVDGCADLDTDGVGDCTVTLVENPSFTTDVSGWTADGTSAWAWDPMNALDDAPSGSGKLSAGTLRGSATQCVSLAAEGQVVIAYANVLVEEGDGSSANQADIEVSFFASDDCSGAPSGSFDTPPNKAAGAWAVVQAGGLPAAPIGSLAVALTAIKATDASAVTVYFDNVMVKAKAP